MNRVSTVHIAAGSVSPVFLMLLQADTLFGKGRLLTGPGQAVADLTIRSHVCADVVLSMPNANLR